MSQSVFLNINCFTFVCYISAERRKIRKWLLDAQDQYTKQTEGAEFLLNGDKQDPGNTCLPLI